MKADLLIGPAQLDELAPAERAAIEGWLVAAGHALVRVQVVALCVSGHALVRLVDGQPGRWVEHVVRIDDVPDEVRAAARNVRTQPRTRSWTCLCVRARQVMVDGQLVMPEHEGCTLRR